MLSYFISQSNEFVVRTEETSSSDLTLHTEDLLTHVTASYDLSGSYTFEGYENILTFSQSLEGTVILGAQYRLTVSDVSGSIWRGAMEVFASQSIDKSIYRTQNDGYVSNVTDNDYIVL